MKIHTVKRVANYLGVTERTVCRWRAAGLLKLNVCGGVWAEQADLDRQVAAIRVLISVQN